MDRERERFSSRPDIEVIMNRSFGSCFRFRIDTRGLVFCSF